MLFLPRKIYDARVILLKDLEDGKVASAEIYQAMLDLDPDDHIAMLGLGRLRKKAGDAAAAKEYFRRALYAHPTVNMAYLELGQLYFDEPGGETLAQGLIELGLSRHTQELPEAVYENSGIKGKAFEEFLNLPAETRRTVFIQSLRERRTLEPAETTARLRGLRLLLEIHESDLVEPQLVDAIVDEGESIVPLLIGLLRDWAQDFLAGEGSDAEIESALALLGETAPAAEIPHLLEFVDLDNPNVSGAAKWALARILERLPDESVQQLASIIPQLGLAERLEIASQILLRPTLDPAGDLHFRLTQNLENIDSESRNEFFPLLLASLAFPRGPLGVRLGRKALEQQRGRLSKAVWRECDELLRAAAEGGLSPLPIEPSPYNVYEICAGEAIWDEEEDDEEETLPDLIPEPVRRTAAPGRNDPCWCGSGKKYKKCHLDADEGQQRPPRPGTTGALGMNGAPGMNEFAPLRKRIGALPGELVSAGELKRAAQEFSGEQEADPMMMLDWILHDWIPPSLGRSMMDEFLLRQGTRLTARERQMVEAWARSYVGLYEVQRLTPGTGIDVKDLITGETMFVHDISMSKNLVRWDVFLGRVLPGERGNELTGAALSVPRASLEPLREWMDERHREAGLGWPEFLKRNWPRIRLQSYEAGRNWMESVRLANSDGEELLVAKAIYSLTDEAAVLHALRDSHEIEIDEGTGREVFVWLNQQRTVLGNIRIAAGQLVLECNSRERLDRGSRWLTHLGGQRLSHLRDEFTSQAEMRRRAKESPPTNRIESSIPKAERDRVIAEVLEKHYRQWPDLPLPALDGETPRAAVRTSHGRRQVMEILKMIENGEERKRLAGEPVYDINRLRAELDLE